MSITGNPDWLASDDTSLYVKTDSGAVVVVDPASNRVVRTLPNAAAGLCQGLGVAFGSPATNKADPPVALGVAGTSLAVDGDTAWVSSLADNTVVQIELPTRSVVARATGLDGPRELAIGDQVWVLTRAGLVALERDGLQQAGMVPTSAAACGLATTRDAVWVSDTDPFLRRIDPASRTVVAAVTTGTSSCGDVLSAHGSIWATASDDDALYRLDP